MIKYKSVKSSETSGTDHVQTHTDIQTCSEKYFNRGFKQGSSNLWLWRCLERFNSSFKELHSNQEKPRTQRKYTLNFDKKSENCFLILAVAETGHNPSMTKPICLTCLNVLCSLVWLNSRCVNVSFMWPSWIHLPSTCLMQRSPWPCKSHVEDDRATQ